MITLNASQIKIVDDLRRDRDDALVDKIELYNEGEYCEEVDEDGDTCLDRCDSTQCNPCMRRIENINSYKS